MKILKRFLSIILFFPAILFFVVFGGILSWAAIIAWIFTGRLNNWPEIASYHLDWLLEWGGK